MLPFQVRTFVRLLTHLGEAEPPGLGPIARRARLAAGLPPFELVNAGLLTLDGALFPYAKVRVEAPIFILSPPRSGSTLLHRLMARDADRFTAFRLWQLIFPSLCAQRLIQGALRLDAAAGGALRRAVEDRERALLSRTDRIHKLRLTEPEEDEALLVHAFASEMLASPFPVPEALHEYRDFDALPEARRRALMGYYRGCVQRHLWIEGQHRRFLSKNPFFCHKVGSLHQTFPDARFILLVRRPDETVASLMSMLTHFRGALGLDPSRQDRHEEAVRFVSDCYEHALAALDRLPAGVGQIIRYEDLVASPRRTVLGLYGGLGIEPDPAFLATLDEAEEQARRYRSPHAYRLEEFGYTPAQIEARFASIYDRFAYPRRA